MYILFNSASGLEEYEITFFVGTSGGTSLKAAVK